jgi:manganese efflux pump family protein
MSAASLFAWIATVLVGLLLLVIWLMAWRWIRVYRTPADTDPTRVVTVPPERHFPLPAVILHGVLAVTTIVLVLFTVLTD